MAVGAALLRAAATDERAFHELIETRASEVRHFLDWAAACEKGAPDTSLRLSTRSDVLRCKSTMHLFDADWWAVVVYSCFDSPTGTRVAATGFPQPLRAGDAEDVLARLDFPTGSVQHHRTQSGLRGARASLLSACEKSAAVEDVLLDPGMTFEARFEQLKEINVRWWGRTTYFDLLVRAGALGIGGRRYSPGKAYLAGSTGPKKGFEKIFGIAVTGALADIGEGVLRRWTRRWREVAEAVGVEWTGDPYGSGDFENALCIFQEPPHAGLPDHAAFRSGGSPPRPRRGAKC